MFGVLTNLNSVLLFTSIVAIILTVFKFRNYLYQGFYRWLIISFLSTGSWSILIVGIDYITIPIINGLILSLFICTPITAAICYFMMTYEFATQTKIPCKMYFLFAIPVILFILALINPNNLVFSFDSAFKTNVGSSVVPGDYRKLRFIINVGLGYALTLMSIGILVSEVLRTSNYTRIYQGITILTSIILICVLSALRLLEIMPYGVDLSAVAINMVLILFILPNTKQKIEEIDMIQTDEKLERIKRPALLVDSKENVVNKNEEAKNVIRYSGTNTDSIIDKNEFSCSIKGEEKHYHVTSVPTDKPVSGTIYVLTDTTDIREEVEDLKVAQQISNRILRHNVKNKLTPIMGYADMIESEEYAEKISESAKSLAETSNKAIQLNKSIDSPSVVESDVAEKVREVIDENEEHEIDASFEGECFDAKLPSNASMLLQECVDNSVEHNNREDLEMSFDVTEKESCVILRYTDNGTGVPQDELEVLDRMTETDMKHSTGCGLWMIKWMVQSSGGEFELENDDGVVIQISLEKP